MKLTLAPIRLHLTLGVLAAALLALPAAAQAAPPVIGATAIKSATDTTATLGASVDPAGAKVLAHFDYTTQADFEANGFNGPLSASTPEVELPSKVTSTGEVTKGSRLITGVAPPVAGAFGRGQILAKPDGFPAALTIENVTAEAGGLLKLEVSAQATESKTQVTLSATGPQPISAEVSGLTPGSAYRFRATAHNTKATPEEGAGPDIPFFTLAPPPTYELCPNDKFRSGELSPFGFPSVHLPDCRSYEQATPVDKDGGDVQSFLSYAKAGADGNSVVWGSTFGAPGAEGAQELPFFLAQRRKDNSGWSSQGLQPPADLGEKGYSLRGWLPDFSATFASAIRLSNPITEALYQLPSDGGAPTLVAPFVSRPGGLSPYAYAGASADGQMVFFESQADLSGHGPTFPLLPGGARNLYAWNAATGALNLASAMNTEVETKSLLPKGAYAGPYAWSDASLRRGGAEQDYYLSAEHAISDDGSVFFTSVSDGQLYERLNPTEPQSPMEGDRCLDPDLACTLHISATRKINGGPDQDGPDPAGPQPAAFMAASADGSISYFTSTEKLTDDANTGPEQPPAQIGVADLSDPDPDATKDEGLIPRHATGLAVDPKGEYLYWADPSRSTIGRAKLTADGSGTEGAIEDDFIAPGETEAITYPETEPGIYHSAPSRPRYVAVGPCAEGGECVYWTNTGPPAGEDTGQNRAGGAVEGGGTIGRVTLTSDHSALEGEPEDEFITGATNPQGIAVNAEHLYWSNAGSSSGARAIGQATLEGDGVNREFIKSSGNETFDGVALSTTHIYAVSNEGGSGQSAFILRFLLSGGEEKFVGSGQKPARGIALDNANVYWSSPGEGNVGRVDLDLTPASKQNQFIPLDGSPTGLALNGTKLFYSVNAESPGNPGNDLYRRLTQGADACSEPGGCLEDLTPEATGNGAEVQGVLGASEDGSYVYFLANAVLDDNQTASPGDCQGKTLRNLFGSCNLYLWHDGTTTFIAELKLGLAETADNANMLQSTSGLTSGADRREKTSFVSPDGRSLVFRSVEPLSDHATNGYPEFYLYRVGQPLTCITCPPAGVLPSAEPKLNTTLYPALGPPPVGVSAVPSRYFSADGRRFFFETTEALVAADTNGESGCPLEGTGSQKFLSCQDVYEWEAPGSGSCTEGVPGWSELNQGCIYLISTGRSPYPSFFIDASESGDDVFFITRDSLVGSDGDSITDVYDARVNGGLASQNAKPQPPCELEGCLPGATPPPPIPAPPNITGPPNPKPKRCKGRKCHKKKHRDKKHAHKKRGQNRHAQKRKAGQ